MKNQLSLLILLTAFLASFFAASPALAQEHPRMYFSEDEISSLRSKADGSLSAIRDQILAHANGRLGSPPAATRNMYNLRSYGTDLITLSFAYVITGQNKYFTAARDRLIAHAEWDYWDREPDVRGLALSDMLIGNALAYDWLYNDLSPAERDKIRTSLEQKANKMYEAGTAGGYKSNWSNWWSNSYVQNHCLIDWAGLGVAALVLDGESAEAGKFLNAARYAYGNIRDNMNRMKDSHWHESTNYGAYAFTKALIFLKNLRDVKNIDLIPHNFFRNYSIWRAHNYIPNSLNFTVPTGDFEWNWNDPSSPHILRFCAAEYGDGIAQWLANHINTVLPRSSNTFAGPDAVLEFLNFNENVPAVPVSNLRPFARFDDLEGVVWRSGWGPGDFIFSFKTGAYGGRASYEGFLNNTGPWSSSPSQGLSKRLNAGHDHDDQHSFFIHFNGSWVAPEHTEYGKNQAAFHNSILIDGYGQWRPQNDNWNDYPANGPRTDGRLERTIDYPDYHYLIADSTNAYKNISDIQKVRRYILYIKPQTVLMLDQFATGSARTFEWVMHFAAGPSREGQWVKAQDSGNVMGVQLLTRDGHENYFGNNGSPWMRSKNSSKRTNTVMSHLLHASRGGNWGSRPQGELIADTGAAQLIRITFSNGHTTDVFINYAGTSSQKTAGDLRTDADLAMVERFANGEVKRIFVWGGTSIADQNGNHVLADGLDAGRAYEIDQRDKANLKIDFGNVR